MVREQQHTLVSIFTPKYLRCFCQDYTDALISNYYVSFPPRCILWPGVSGA